VAKKDPLPDAGAEKQRPLGEAKKKAEQAGPHGKQPHEIAERANMKRQQKKMHEQDNK
jgi:hypothetical protein